MVSPRSMMKYKNIMYNSLDVVAKNFFGLYISYKIKNLSPQTL